MKIEMIDPVELLPSDYNPRRINDHQLDSLMKSIEKYGFVEPVVINTSTGRIVGGHQRVQAATKLGLSKIPVTKVDLGESDEKALNVALNKISGDWDIEMLTEILSDLGADGYELEDLGFSGDELDDLIEEWDKASDLDNVGDYDGEASEGDFEVLTMKVPADIAETVLLAIKGMIDKNDWPFSVEK